MSKLPLWAQLFIIILLSLVIGGGGLWWATTLSDPIKSIIVNLSAIIITSGFFSWWGAYQARIEVTRYLSKNLDLSENIKTAGIRSVANWPITLPANAQQADFLLIRGHAWFSMQSVALSKLMKNSKSEIRICLVHPGGDIIPALATKFSESIDGVKTKILETIAVIVEIAEKAKSETINGRLQMRCHKLIPTHTFYRFDETGYLVWYGLHRGKIDVPMLRIGPGSLYEFFQDDFNRLWSERDTEQVYDTAEQNSINLSSLKSLGLAEEKLKCFFESDRY